MNQKNEFSTTGLDQYLKNMWNDYCLMNPQAREISNAFESKNEVLVNDHIALRTVNHSKLGIKSLARHFEKYGYFANGEYFFKEKKLYAQHFENKLNPDFPKIFISELELEKMSPFVNEIYSKIIEEFPLDSIDNETFVYGGTFWKKRYEIYARLAEESEYASWLYAFGFRPNHFTVSVNHLKNFKELKDVNLFIKNLGYSLNSSGGEIKGTPQELLEQSSTLANLIEVNFEDGAFKIPSCYYEFAKRYPLKNGINYQGFIAQSADKIFESTNKAAN